ncbi:MAG TPA: hypothetical protein VHK06_07615, partial [Candidatus Limnocylindria bacterium]|nr:hypothetical protein [Candidatus Limnocylindria bacterium]
MRSGWMRRSLTAGAIAGAAAVYLATVGLVAAFQARPAVTDVVSIGHLMLAACPFVAGMYLGNRYARAGASAGRLLTAAAVAGAVAGSVMAAFAALVGTVDLNGVFVALNQRLADFLTFDAGPVTGGLLLVVAGTVLATLGGALRLLNAPERSAILAALAATVILSILEPLLSPILGRLELGAVDRFLYSGGGLTPMGAMVTLFGAGLLSSAWTRGGAGARRSFREMPSEQRRPVSVALIVAAFALVLVL